MVRLAGLLGVTASCGVWGLCGCDLVFSLDPAPDAVDPCASVDPHFEDTDDHPDCNDNCPGIDNQTQDDDDKDGVGDACDPNRNAPGDPDTLLIFEPFANMTALDDWTKLNGGTWTVEGDKLVQADASDTRFGLLRTDDPAVVPASLEVRMRVDSTTTPFSAFHFGVSATDNTLMSPHCTLSISGANPTGGLIAFDETNISRGATAPMPIVAGDTYQISLTQLDSTLRCKVVQLSTNLEAMTSTPLAVKTIGGVYLANHSMTMAIDYVAVYGRK